MGEKLTEKTAQIMDERFGCDTLLSVATVEEGMPSVRIDRKSTRLNSSHMA